MNNKKKPQLNEEKKQTFTPLNSQSESTMKRNVYCMPTQHFLSLIFLKNKTKSFFSFTSTGMEVNAFSFDVFICLFFGLRWGSINGCF